MGSEFFWFLDILVLAVAAGNILRGIQKGAVAVLISAVAAVLAFIIAFIGSNALSGIIYDNYVKKPLEQYIDEQITQNIDISLISGLSELDMDKARIKDVYLKDIEPDYDDKDTALIDLSSVDLTETGIQYADLSAFGIKSDTDFSAIKLGSLEITKNQFKRYGLGDIVLSYYIASSIGSSDIMESFKNIGERITDTVKFGTGRLGEELSDGRSEIIYPFILTVINIGDASCGEALLEEMISPLILTPIKVILFLLIFIITVILLNVIASVSKLMNKIPLVGSVNTVLGAFLGLAESVVVLMIICIIIRFLISMCGENLVFINTATIENTFIFKHIYALDPLKPINI